MMKRAMTAAAAAVLAVTSVSGAALAQPGHGGPAPGQVRYDDHRGPPGPDRSHRKWRKGERIGRDDWRRYRAVDWRRHHLRQPPRGYEWREVNGDYVLAAAATGLIASIIIANH